MSNETVIDPKMLTILVCPKTRAPLTYNSETNELISKKAKLAYPIREFSCFSLPPYCVRPSL